MRGSGTHVYGERELVYLILCGFAGWFAVVQTHNFWGRVKKTKSEKQNQCTFFDIFEELASFKYSIFISFRLNLVFHYP